MMTPERWRQISEVFHVALARDEASRGAFLDEACAGDTALRAEVEAMLGAHREAGRFGDVAVVALHDEGSRLPEGPTEELNSEPGTSPRGRHPFFWIVWIASLATAAAFTHGASLLILNGGTTTAFGWNEVRRGDGWFVTRVDADGPAAGLVEQGDRLISLNGVPPAGSAGMAFQRRYLSVGEAYQLVVDRQGKRLESTLIAWKGPNELATRLTYLFVSLVYCVVGLFIGLARPEQPVARLASGAAVMTGLGLLSGLIQSGPLFHPMHVIVACHFFARFPSGRAVTGISRWILVLMYSAGAVPFVLGVWLHGALLGVPGLAALMTRHASLFGLRGLAPYLFYASPILMVTLVARNYRILADENERRRVRWVVYGSIVALTPQVLWSVAAVFGIPAVPGFGRLANLFTVGIPLVVAYAVVKHRVFDIKVVVRRGVQYLLARGALQALVVIPIAVLVYTAVSNRDQTIAQLAGGSAAYLYWSGAAALTLRFRRPVGVWLDRRFFREEYDRERLLLKLLDDLSRIESMAELSRLVNGSLESAFHPKAVHLWHRNPDRLELGYSSHPLLTAGGLPAGCRLLSWLEEHGRVVGFPLPADAGLSRDEARWLRALGATLVVPIADSADRLVGVWLLGEKKSEEPYSANDRRLLETIAKQTAFISENLRLKGQVVEEQRFRHDVLARLDERHASLLKECPSCGACFDAPTEHCNRDGHELVLSLPVGRTIDERYRLDQLIGKGGMGAVYEARDLQLERTVAVKIMLGRAFGDQRTLRRSRREARAAAQLNHPNIVGVYDVGRLEAGGAYLVMERVRGVTLRSELQHAGTLPSTVAADWFEQLLDGISAAHQHGIVHRDLKPENVIGLRQDPRSLVVKILDFGLAKLSSEATLATGTLTTEGAVVGTLGYMSPEQLLGQDVDHRTDIFAVGVMLAEALTGQRPFQGDTYGDFVQAAIHAEYHLPGCSFESRAINDVVQRCLAKDRRDRFASASELRRGLIPALRASTGPAGSG